MCRLVHGGTPNEIAEFCVHPATAKGGQNAAVGVRVRSRHDVGFASVLSHLSW